VVPANLIVPIIQPALPSGLIEIRRPRFVSFRPSAQITATPPPPPCRWVHDRACRRSRKFLLFIRQLIETIICQVQGLLVGSSVLQPPRRARVGAVLFLTSLAHVGSMAGGEILRMNTDQLYHLTTIAKSHSPGQQDVSI